MIPEFSGDFIQWLRGFYAVAEAGSISKAALRINRSKPAVVGQIRSLENTLGVTLFVRRASGMTLTPEGTRLLEHTKALFEMILDITRSLRQKDSGFVLTTNHFVLSRLVELVGEFTALHPAISPHFAGHRTQDAVAAVRQGEAALGIIPQIPLPADVLAVPVFSSSFVLISAPDNPFNIPPAPEWDDLARLPLIAFAQNGTIHALLRKAGECAGKDLRITEHQHHFATIRQLVRMGRGVTVVDKEAVRDDSLLQFSLDHLLEPRLWVLITLKDRPPSPAVQQFLHWAVEDEALRKGWGR